MARFGQIVKDRAVARLLPPESAAITTVSQEMGVSVATLERWMANALSRPAAASRLEAVIATAALDDAQRSAWCREQGLFPADLQHWRQSATAALSQPEEARASPQETRDDRRRIKELERDLRRQPRATACRSRPRHPRGQARSVYPGESGSPAALGTSHAKLGSDHRRHAQSRARYDSERRASRDKRRLLPKSDDIRRYL